ncbi:MAG: HEAT repeat domain-containing protein [Planctomycetes bacterium]|nr:HEAT repeat domain-containing protein [Planctomycetota bacterium]
MFYRMKRKRLLYIYAGILLLFIILFHSTVFSIIRESFLFGQNPNGVSTIGQGNPHRLDEDDLSYDSEHIIGRALMEGNLDSQETMDALYKAIEKSPADPLPHFIIATECYEFKMEGDEDPAPALLHLKKAIQLDPDNGFLHHCLAEMYMYRAGAQKYDDIWQEVLKGNRAPRYDSYQQRMAKAVYYCQRNDSVSDFRKRLTMLSSAISYVSRSQFRYLTERFVWEAHRSAVKGENQKALQYLAELMLYANRRSNGTEDYATKMIGLAMQSKITLPLRRLNLQENKITEAEKHSLIPVKLKIYNDKNIDFGKKIMNTTLLHSSVNLIILVGFVISAAVAIILSVLLKRGRRLIGRKTIAFCVILFFACYGAGAYFAVTWAIAETASDAFGTIFAMLQFQCDYGIYWRILPAIGASFLIVLMAALVLSRLQYGGLRKSLSDTPKWHLSGFRSAVRWIAVVFFAVFCLAVAGRYSAEYYLAGKMSTGNLPGLLSARFPDDEEAKKVLDEYLSKADAIIVKLLRDNQMSDDERDIIIELFRSQDMRFEKKIAGNFEFVKIFAYDFKSSRAVAYNGNPVFWHAWKEKVMEEDLKSVDDWRIPWMVQSGDKDFIPFLRKFYNVLSKNSNDQRANISIELFLLGEKEELFSLLEQSTKTLELLAYRDVMQYGDLMADEKFRGKFLELLRQNESVGYLLTDLFQHYHISSVSGEDEMKACVSIGENNSMAFYILRAGADKTAAGPLISLLDDEYNKIGSARVIFLLGELGAQDVVDAIKARQWWASPDVRYACIYALNKLLPPEEMSPILKEHRSDPDYFCRMAVWQIENLR